MFSVIMYQVCPSNASTNDLKIIDYPVDFGIIGVNLRDNRTKKKAYWRNNVVIISVTL